ncbi:MAG TPA: ComF family protein [Patescibacteria group bacterium]|jgi:ComF family protein
MVLSRLLDALFPPRCVACASPGCWWCTGCDRKLLPPPDGPTPGLDRLLAAAAHRDPVTHLVKSLKYRHAKAVVPAITARLAPLAADVARERPLLVPVPLHSRRLRERGHNQSALIAEAVSEATGLPLSDALARRRYTRTQTGLGRADRHRNVDGAFEWTGAALGAQPVLLVDDVYTTGATLAACAEACRASGVKHVYGLTVGRR